MVERYCLKKPRAIHERKRKGATLARGRSLRFFRPARESSINCLLYTFKEYLLNLIVDYNSSFHD